MFSNHIKLTGDLVFCLATLFFGNLKINLGWKSQVHDVMGRGWMWQSLVILIDCKISVLDLQRETEHIQVISFQRVRKEQWSMTETLHGHHAVFPWRLGKFPKGVVVSGKVTLICDWQEHMTGNRTPQSRAQAGSLSPTEVPQCHLPNPLLYQNDAALFRETRKTFLPQSL